MTASVILLALISYAYAMEGTDCNTVISPPCMAASFTGTGNPDCVSGTGVYVTAGNNVDQCVTAFGFLGSNGCTTPTVTWCVYTTYIIFCNGTQSTPTIVDAHTTFNETTGPCQ